MRAKCYSSLPPGFIVRPASIKDRFAIQKLVLRLIKEEALELIIRVLIFRFLIPLVLVTLALLIQLWITFLNLSSVVNFILLITIFYTLGIIFLYTFYLIKYLMFKLTKPLLDWSFYLVIEYEQSIVACGAIEHFAGYSIIYNLFVKSNWRQQGLGSRLMKYLKQQTYSPLYLVCKPNLIKFYGNFGFMPITWRDLPPPIKRVFRTFKPGSNFRGYPLEIMEYHRDNRE